MATALGLSKAREVGASAPASGPYHLPKGYLSPSQVWRYYSCPLCYRLEYIDKLPKPVNADLLIGLAMHSGIETIRRRWMERPSVADTDLDEMTTATVEEFDRKLSGAEDEESGAEMIFDLKKYADPGEVKDMAVGLVKAALPEIAKYDLAQGIRAVEAWVPGLGTPWLEEEEGQDLTPVFPFEVRARLDCLYDNWAIKDSKSAGRSGKPAHMAMVQLKMQGMAFHYNGIEPLLGIDQFVKTKTPKYNQYWVNGDGRVKDWDGARAKVLYVAERISAGDFQGRPDWYCSYDHEVDDFSLTVGEFPA